MKTLSSDKYRYLGVKDEQHVFLNIQTNDELIYLRSARFINEDGTSTFYDPVSTIRRLNAYYERLAREIC